ncbi:hypothetical protein [Pseudonocardia sp. ICBG162]|uniref:hypothetical protein n=1 Tax=Pseudonocardia sp. ICBG162 TaxID=2846761 RepID=UPI001CF61A9D|nr:hypothetical protein [Pseudonocardia sp. ICBG162]
MDASRVVHAEQAFRVVGPLPVEGRVRVTATVTEVLDKGPGRWCAPRPRPSTRAPGNRF